MIIFFRHTLKQIMISLWYQTEESRNVLNKGMLRMLVGSQDRKLLAAFTVQVFSRAPHARIR